MGVLALAAIVDFLDTAKLAPGLRLEEIEVRSGSPLAARAWERPAPATRTPRSSPSKRSGAQHLAVPDHDTILAAGDLVLVLGPEQTLKTMAG